MRTVRMGLCLLAVLAACGEQDARKGEAREVAQQWADAVNERDWPRACSLSEAPGDPQCPSRLRDAFSQTGEFTVEEVLRFVERDGDRYVVHPEVTIVR